METAYLLEKLELKQVKRFIKQLSKFLIRQDNMQRIIENIPTDETINDLDELNVKKELYRLFNFYIPMWKMLVVYDPKNYMNYELYQSVANHVSSDVMTELIIGLWEANETIISQCQISFDHSHIKKTILDAIGSEEKSDDYK